MTKKELLRRIERLENATLPYVKDDNSGFLIAREDAVEIYGSCEKQMSDWLGLEYVGGIPKTFHFKRGSEPKADYIKVDLKGVRTYIRNNVPCDKNGKVLKK